MNRYLTISLFFVLGLCALTASVAQAAPVVLDSVADARMFPYYGEADTNFGATGNMNVSTGGHQSVVKFDISGLAAGYQVDSATLTLTRVIDATASDANIYAWRVIKDWTETGVTWNSYSTGNAWTNPGGDAVGTGGEQLVDAYGTVFVQQAGAAVGDKVDIDVTNLVSEWYEGTNANFGILLTGGNVDFSTFYFGTKETGGNNQPILTVTLSQVPEPGTLALLATGLVGLLCYAWRKRK